ncbi:MAG: HAD-IA family hydrolase [Nitrosomonadales bacterium]|nr:HAD-IA family hydrolase [Nitrosomonadales bacterium]
MSPILASTCSCTTPPGPTPDPPSPRAAPPRAPRGRSSRRCWCTPENVAGLLEAGLGKGWESYFAANGCGDIVPHKKPAPDIYYWVLERLHLDASGCIALEDSENGLRASLAAGIKTCITTNRYTRNQDFTGAAAVFDDLSDPGRFYRAAGLALPEHPPL